MRTQFLCLLLVGLCMAWEPPPADISRDYLEADAVLDEEPCAWREPLGAIFRPAVQHCADAREAALHIAAHMTQLTGAYYSVERRKANMNALEALAEKKISCTGQSILLACALRSVGIPARAVIVLTWGHIPGNHTWVEAWVYGQWEMLEFNEKAFNTHWVMENIGLLDPGRPEQRIYAISPHSALRVPYFSGVAAEDVTARYMQLSRAWDARDNLPPHHQRRLVDVQPRPKTALSIRLETEDGAPLATAPSPAAQSDLRYLTPFNLPRSGGPYYLRLSSTPSRIPVSATPSPAQVLTLKSADAVEGPDNQEDEEERPCKGDEPGGHRHKDDGQREEHQQRLP